MIKRAASLVLIALFALLLFRAVGAWRRPEGLGPLAGAYAQRTAGELGAANIVTAIVVTYRGLDTLGEVTVLFLAATGVALLLRRRSGAGPNGGDGSAERGGEEGSVPSGAQARRPASEILETGAGYLMPVIVMFGVYIFLNGHLTPGGGFQGGAIVASAVLLALLSFPDYRLRHTVLAAVESSSGFLYVAIGLLGALLAGGFLDNRMLPLGAFGAIASAGAIPVIYTLIGLKVGTELAGVVENLGGRE
jgi:multicomponent Na+:H+ antiporter subunit B